MDINKLSNHIDRKLDGTRPADQNQKAANNSVKAPDSEIADKVSLNSFKSNKSEELFAKIELEKLKHNSFDKLKEMKAKLSEYEAAKSDSQKDVKETALGKMLDNPEVWEEIAKKITGE